MAKKLTRNTSSRKAATNGHRQHGIYDEVLSVAGTLMRGQKNFGAEKLASLADATREFAASMPEMPNFQVYVDSAAKQLEDLAGYVLETDFEAMIDDAGSFARRHPLATIGLGIAAGLGATRLIYQPFSGRTRGSPRTVKATPRRAMNKRTKAASTKKAAGRETGTNA